MPKYVAVGINRRNNELWELHGENTTIEPGFIDLRDLSISTLVSMNKAIIDALVTKARNAMDANTRRNLDESYTK